MRYMWGGISLFAFSVGIVGFLIALSAGDDINRAALGGVIAFVGLLVAYVAYKLRRRRKHYPFD